MIELRRANLLNSLETLAESGHLLVVGEPGAGKSWLLKEFVSRRREGGDGVVFLRAEDHAVASLSDLYKSIGVADFLAALRDYSGERKFLAIDSLDSLRTEGSQRAFRDLIRIVQAEAPMFTVVASIRTFDMQRSPELHKLFPSKDDVSSNAQEYSARHLLVPVFSEAELEESLAQDVRLRPIVGSASGDAKNLLRNPFNLWLVIHLLDAGAPVNWLSTIQSEVQLLDNYWFYRIDARDDGISKTTLLKLFTERMVNFRLMSVALRDFSPSDVLDAPLNKLLSDEILTKSETGRISYAHNILFDFAISRLLIDEQNVMTFLLSAPARAIFYRPSVSYLMTRLWFRDRILYWKLAESFFERRPQTPAIVSITAARSVFDLARTNDDLVPLFALPTETRLRAIVSLLRAIRALDEQDSQNRFLWIGFLVTSVEYLDTQFLNEGVALIEVSLQNAATNKEVQLLTILAVYILRWIWEKAENESDVSAARSLADFAAGRLVPIVAKNYCTIPDAAKPVLTELIGRLSNTRSSASEAFRLASNLDSVIECDPDLASDIYVAILGHEETSNEETQLGGAVLPLLSRRSQDFSLSHYVLGTKFRALVARDSVIAARTAARSVTAEVKIKESNTIKSLRAYEWTFQFLGKQITLNSDRSEIWDHFHRDYTAIELVNQLLYSLKGGLESAELSADAVRSVLCELGQANEFAVTWKRVLNYASNTPEFLTIIPDLLQIPELLAAPETTEAAGAAIRKAYEKDLFSAAEFSAIQEAILRITALPLASIFREPRYVRDALLECVPAEKREAAAITALEGRKADLAKHASAGFSQVEPGVWGPDEEDGWLKRQGVETERADNRALLTATHSLKPFESQFMSQAQAPSRGDAGAIIDRLWSAYQLVRANATADERVVTDALTTVAAVAKNILRNKEFTEDADEIAKCKDIIAFAAEYPLPLPPDDADANFDRPAWSPTPKIEAAQGVMNYLGNWGTEEKLKLLAVNLSADHSPAVRLQIAMSLAWLYEKNRDWFWKIANDRLGVENAIGVLASMAHAVTHPHIAKRERKAVIGWQTSLLGRKLPSGRIDEVLKALAHSLTDLYVFFGDKDASEALKILEREPAKHSTELAQVALSATFYLADGIKEDDQTKVEMRARAREVWTRALNAADVVISNYFDTPKPASTAEIQREQEVLKGALTIIDSAVFQLYLLFRVNEHLVRENLPSLDDPQRRKLFMELDPIWRLLLGSTGPQHKGLLPASTTHHLVELFRTTVSYDPPRVLQLTADLFKGFNMGYQSDQMAIGEVVRFAEIIMADHKEILKDSTNAANLAFILDQFVEFGWPQATQVLMKLDSAVR